VTYTLTMHTVGSGSVEPDGGTYISGTLLSLAATPDTNWQFDGWTGDLVSTTNPINLTMDGDKSITATFSAVSHTLTVNVVGGGTVTPTAGAHVYVAGTVVTLTATPGPGMHFGGWTGDLVSADNPESLVMDGDKVVTATFSAVPPVTHTLTVHTVGSGTVDPDGGTYISGTVLSLSAIPAPDWQFDAWSGDVGGTATPISLMMDGDKVVTATFTEVPIVPTYTLTTIISPTMGGAVTLDPSGGVYAENTVVTLTAVPALDYTFTAWSGDLSSTANPVSITMTMDVSVTATFEQGGYDIYLPLLLRNG
jgi:uncharacterized repeat protein (TIGR02543 family)